MELLVVDNHGLQTRTVNALSEGFDKHVSVPLHVQHLLDWVVGGLVVRIENQLLTNVFFIVSQEILHLKWVLRNQVVLIRLTFLVDTYLGRMYLQWGKGPVPRTNE